MGAQVAGGPADVPTSKPSRAGRDLRSAILVGVGLGAMIIVSLLTVKETFIGIVAAAAAVSTWEIANAFKKAGINVALWPALIGGQAIIWLSWPLERSGMMTAFVVTVLVCMIWRFRGGSDGYLRDLSASVFTVAYVAVVRGVRGHAGRAGRRRGPGVRVHHRCRAVRHRRLHGRCLPRQAPDGAHDQPEEVLGGLRGSSTAGAVGGALTVTPLLDGQWWQGALFGAVLVVTADRGRPGRVADQARPRHQGHGHAAARPRRPDGPDGLAAAVRRRLLAAAAPLRAVAASVVVRVVHARRRLVARTSVAPGLVDHRERRSRVVLDHGHASERACRTAPRSPARPVPAPGSPPSRCRSPARR